MNAAGLILHVDDEPSVRASMALLLHADGYGVDSAAGGAEAFQLVNSGFRPDVLIVDFNLGQQMTGVEVAEQVGTMLGYAPPIIILTGEVRKATFPRFTDVVVWLTSKPVNPQLLLTALPSFVQLSRAARELNNR